ncbi:MAG: hypothetical protein M3135_08670 [Actinomycetota bacterium]|nr:hypothetical protein [Actinomycetota bacterium]
MRSVLAALLLAAACTGDDAATRPPPGTLIRDGATPTIVRSGDLDGRGSAELVVASVSPQTGAFGLPDPYVEVFAERDGAWRRVFDATGTTPPGAPSDAPPVLEPADPSVALGQTIEVLELVDFAADGSSEIVLAVANAGAGGGPVAVWILTMPGGAVRAEFLTVTERGGRVSVGEDTVELEFGVYRRKDPGCCPSLIERQTLGWDGEAERVTVVERDRRKVRRST